MLYKRFPYEYFAPTHPFCYPPRMNDNYTFGLHAVQALLSRDPQRVHRLCVTKDRSDKKLTALIERAREKDIAIEQTTKEALDKLTAHANHQGVVALCRKAKTYDERDLKTLLENTPTPPFVLILDGV